MTITLKKCLSEKNHLTRVFDDTEGATLTMSDGALRDMSSIMDPVIRVPGTSDIAGFNYMEIPAFGRKYFITDSPVLVTGMWEIHAHVDVIGTWLTQIKECKAYVVRRKQANNKYLTDNQLQLENRELNQILRFEKAEGPLQKDGYSEFPDDTWTYCLITQGPGPDV